MQKQKHEPSDSDEEYDDSLYEYQVGLLVDEGERYREEHGELPPLSFYRQLRRPK